MAMLGLLLTGASLDGEAGIDEFDDAREQRVEAAEVIGEQLEYARIDAEDAAEDEQAQIDEDRVWHEQRAAANPLDDISEASCVTPCERRTLKTLEDMVPSDEDKAEYERQIEAEWL